MGFNGDEPRFTKAEIAKYPKDWKIVPYTSIGIIIDGDRGSNYPSKDEFETNGYCLFLNAGNVTNLVSISKNVNLFQKKKIINYVMGN